jgi:subtilisin family serine protease
MEMQLLLLLLLAVIAVAVEAKKRSSSSNVFDREPSEWLMIADAELLRETMSLPSSSDPSYQRRDEQQQQNAVPLHIVLHYTGDWTVQSVAWNLCSQERCIAICAGTEAQAAAVRAQEGVYSVEPVTTMTTTTAAGWLFGSDDDTQGEEDRLGRHHETERTAGSKQRTVIGAAGASLRTPTIWNLDRIDQRWLPLDNQISTLASGASVHAYVVDTGIMRPEHSEMTGRVSWDYDAIGNGRGAVDCHGHGTHVAGTLGGSNVGVATGVHLHAIAVLNCDGSGPTSALVRGLDWVAANAQRPAVVSMSLGLPSVSAAVNFAVDALFTEHDLPSFVAAGNANTDACRWSPASATHAFAVAASTGSDARASFSNYGKCVSIFAPGVAVESAALASPTSLVAWSGTSMATPHVSGTAAVLQSLRLSRSMPALSAASLYATLQLVATTTALQRSTLGSSQTPNYLLYELIQAETAATVTPAAATPQQPAVRNSASLRSSSSIGAALLLPIV